MFNFAPKTRKLIYAVIAALVPVLVTFGYLSPEIAKEILSITAAFLTIAGSALAIKNVPEQD